MFALMLFLLVVVCLPLFWAIGAYNRLVGLRNRFKNAFSQIDIQLKRRYDLIPNLVETVKGYMKHEATTLEAVISARNGAVAANHTAAADPANSAAVSRLGEAEAQLSGSLGRLLAVSESYPDLKANENVAQLMEELSSTENKISFARQGYNDSVMTYNTGIEQFPASVVAGMFQFRPAELLEAVEAPAERVAPKVQF